MTAINFMPSKHIENNSAIDSKSDNTEIIIGKETDEVIK